MEIRNRKAAKTTALILVCLCATVAALTAAPRTTESATAKRKFTLKFITYNVCALPDMFIFDRNLVMPTSKRLEYIGERLKKYDVAGLQEAFQFKRTILEKELGEYYVGHGADIANIKNVGSGVYTFSRYSVTRIYYERWNPSSGADSFSHKGLVEITTEIAPGLSLDVYNLHGQAGGENSEEIRSINYDQLNNSIKMLSRGTGHPIVMLGDYNCEFGEPACDHLLKITGVKSVIPKQEGVDHIFYDENNSNWKITVLDYKKAFPYDGDGMVNGKYVSDHEAFEATLQFEEK